MADLGIDFAGANDLTPELSLVEGEDCLINDLIWRLRTDRGALFYDKDYGTNLTRFLHAPIVNPNIIGQAAVEECLKDPRVEASMVAKTELSADRRTVTLSLAGTTAAGPFELVTLVNALSVTLLTKTT